MSTLPLGICLLSVCVEGLCLWEVLRIMGRRRERGPCKASMSWEIYIPGTCFKQTQCTNLYKVNQITSFYESILDLPQRVIYQIIYLRIPLHNSNHKLTTTPIIDA